MDFLHYKMKLKALITKLLNVKVKKPVTISSCLTTLYTFTKRLLNMQKNNILLNMQFEVVLFLMHLNLNCFNQFGLIFQLSNERV